MTLFYALDRFDFHLDIQKNLHYQNVEICLTYSNTRLYY